MKRYEGNGRMSKVVEHGGVLYLSGQTGTPGASMQEQTKEVLTKIEQLLGQYGSDKRHILSATIFIEHVSMFADMNAVWDAWVESGYEPARACLEASVNDKRKLVEIVVTAALKQ
jgi:enamine deaminase RidA (YjgF/YER057c/UK114 family)